jgi:hypothetical protein
VKTLSAVPARKLPSTGETMSQLAPVTEIPATETPVSPQPFVDRRNYDQSEDSGFERRQFSSSHEGLTPDAKELAQAIDRYKLRHRRRFITYEEILDVVKVLGYHR